MEQGSKEMKLQGRYPEYTRGSIISEETSIFAPQRLRFYKALGVAACTVGKVRPSTVFMCVCSTFRPSDFFTIRQKRIRGGGALPR